MKFGKQLEVGTYVPWQLYYLSYSKLKRIIKRKQYLNNINKNKNKNKNKIDNDDSDDDNNKNDNINDDKLTKEYNEYVEKSLKKDIELISGKYGTTGSSKSINTNSTETDSLLNKDKEKLEKLEKLDNVDPEDFFVTIEYELDKVTKFVIGKIAELRLRLGILINSQQNPNRTHHTDGDRTYLINLKDIYIQLIALKKFCNLNSTGFIKIIKKYDKVFHTHYLNELWQDKITKEMISTTVEPQILINEINDIVSKDNLLDWEKSELENYSDNMSNKIIFKSLKLNRLIFSISIFIISYFLPLIQSDLIAKKCLSLLLFVISLWITEALPYFATALIIPVLVTYLNILTKQIKNDNNEIITVLMTRSETAAFTMDHMFSHTTALILGGYTISSALSSCQLELQIASYFQKWFGSSPKLFMLSIMLLGLFLSMWISNHTAPILCNAIILPIIRDLPSHSNYTKALLLGIAFACNFGGLMTPIASLQNVIAVSQLQEIGIEVSFFHWMMIAVPFGILATILAWFIISFITHPDEDIKKIPIVILDLETPLLTNKSIIIMVSCFITCILFASFTFLKDYFGDIGIISFCFVAFMFGTGILTEVDFHALNWHTLMLLGGGSVLGKAVELSGLMNLLSNWIISILPLNFPWLALFYILICTGMVATFVSHTVAALIILPMVTQLGALMGIPIIVVMTSGFVVSAAMALPFSSFPNVNALLVVDDFKKSYLKTYDFIITGVPITIISIILIATVVYGFIELLF